MSNSMKGVESSYLCIYIQIHAYKTKGCAVIIVEMMTARILKITEHLRAFETMPFPNLTAKCGQ